MAAGVDSFDKYLAAPGDFGGAVLATALQGTGIDCPAINAELMATYATTLLAGSAATTTVQ